MKKKTLRSLSLAKETIVNLQDRDMKAVKGATVAGQTCGCDTASCSIAAACCRTTTTTEGEVNMAQLDLDF